MPPLTDLQAVLAGKVNELTADDWEAEGDYAWGFVFVRRGGERLEVTVQSVATVDVTHGAPPPSGG